MPVSSVCCVVFIAPFCGFVFALWLNGKEERDMRQHVGASALVSPWWGAASEGGVRHEVLKYGD